MFAKIAWKKWKELALSSKKPKSKKPKIVRANIAAVAESVREAPSTSTHRLSQQLNISETSLRWILHKEFCIKTLIWRHTKSNWFDRLTEDAGFGKKKSSFQMKLIWSWRICKQAKLSYLENRKPARVHWKANVLKTCHCLVQILVQRHNWAILLRKRAISGRYSQWRSLSGHVGFNTTALCTSQPKLHSMFYTVFLKIALSVAELMSKP